MSPGYRRNIAVGFVLMAIALGLLYVSMDWGNIWLMLLAFGFSLAGMALVFISATERILGEVGRWLNNVIRWACINILLSVKLIW